MPQLQHNMWVVAARSAVLPVITGGSKWVEIATHDDLLIRHLIVTASPQSESSGAAASSGIKDFSSALDRSCSRKACRVLRNRPANSAQEFDALIDDSLVSALAHAPISTDDVGKYVSRNTDCNIIDVCYLIHHCRRYKLGMLVPTLMATRCSINGDTAANFP
jgi:hypothetical protein